MEIEMLAYDEFVKLRLKLINRLEKILKIREPWSNINYVDFENDEVDVHSEEYCMGHTFTGGFTLQSSSLINDNWEEKCLSYLIEEDEKTAKRKRAIAKEKHEQEKPERRKQYSILKKEFEENFQERTDNGRV